MAYDVKYRKRVMEYLEEGHTQKEAQEVFKVGHSTLSNWRKLLTETGSLQKRPLDRKHKKIDPEKLKACVAEHPDAYLKEIAGAFNCSDTAVGKALARLKITRKKDKGLQRAR